MRNPENETVERVSVAENDILDIFTGEKGGIAVFSGKGFPEETGLLFERANGDDKQALILFFHPTENPEIYNSVVGLGEFLHQINEELASDTDIQLQKDALARLKDYEEKGWVDFGSKAVRKEIFYLQVIANARKAGQEDRTYAQEVERLVPREKKNMLGKRVQPPLTYQQTVNGSINGVLVDFTNPIASEKTRKPVKEDKKGPVQTERGEILLRNFDAECTDEGQISLINQLVTWVDTFKTYPEYEDIKYLLAYFLPKLGNVTLTLKASGKSFTTRSYLAHIEQSLLERRQKLFKDNTI